MFKFDGCGNNTLIWVALAAVLLLSQSGRGFDLGGLFGCGDETLIILAVVAFLFFSGGGLGFLEANHTHA